MLLLAVKHPCRSAVFTPQVILPISSVVPYGPDTMTVSPFSHSLDLSTTIDCGMQSLTIWEDAAFTYPFITVSTQTLKTDSHVISVQTGDYAHVNLHTPYAVVSLIDWPDVTINTDPFPVEIKACSLTSSQWTDSSSMILNADYILESP